MKAFFVCCIVLVITACGGGGGEQSNNIVTFSSIAGVVVSSNLSSSKSSNSNIEPVVSSVGISSSRSSASSIIGSSTSSAQITLGIDGIEGAEIVTDQQITIRATYTDISSDFLIWSASPSLNAFVMKTGSDTAVFSASQAGSYIVKLSSLLDPSKTGSITIVVSPDPNGVIVELLELENNHLLINDSKMLLAKVTGVSTSGLSWKASPAEDATLEQEFTDNTFNGIYFKASKEGSYVITATSIDDPKKSDSVTIFVEHADKKNFTKDETIQVWLHYQSFVDSGFTEKFSDFTKANLEAAIRICIDQWVQNTGMNLNVRFMGITNSDTTETGNIIVRGVAKHSEKDDVLATAILGGVNYSTIRFYLTGVSENEREWKVFPSEENKNGLLSVLIHEMGHSFGLAHNYDVVTDTVMFPGHQRYRAYGPHRDDIADVIALYGYRPPFTINVLRSVNEAIDWSAISTNINSVNVESSLPLSLVRDSERFLMFYTDMKTHSLKYVFADLDGITWSLPHNAPAELPYSKYGVSVHGTGNEYMVAWVDDDKNKIKIWYSSDAGDSWAYRNPNYDDNFLSSAGGTPAIHKLTSNKWILSYVKMGPVSDLNKIVSRISIDDGKTWGEEVELFTEEKLRGIRGVSVTSNGAEKIRITFASFASEEHKDVTSVITMVTAHLDENNQLIADDFEHLTNAKTDTEPSITTALNTVVLGYRNEASDLFVSYADKSAESLANKKSIDNGWNIVAPTVVANKDRNRIYMFQLK